MPVQVRGILQIHMISFAPIIARTGVSTSNHKQNEQSYAAPEVQRAPTEPLHEKPVRVSTILYQLPWRSDYTMNKSSQQLPKRTGQS